MLYIFVIYKQIIQIIILEKESLTLIVDNLTDHNNKLLLWFTVDLTTQRNQQKVIVETYLV
jgi:hypothetical protein